MIAKGSKESGNNRLSYLAVKLTCLPVQTPAVVTVKVSVVPSVILPKVDHEAEVIVQGIGVGVGIEVVVGIKLGVEVGTGVEVGVGGIGVGVGQEEKEKVEVGE